MLEMWAAVFVRLELSAKDLSNVWILGPTTGHRVSGSSAVYVFWFLL